MATTSDLLAKEIMARINDPSPGIKSSYLNQFTTRDGLLYRKPWNCYLEGFGGPNLGSLLRNLSRHVMYVLGLKRLTIGHTVFFTRSPFQVDHGLSIHGLYH